MFVRIRIACSRVLTKQILPLALLAIASTLAISQADQGTINGAVSDQTGAVVIGATVTLTNWSTDLKLIAQTDKNGVYIFTPLKIGDYRISVSAPGFATAAQENIHLDVQQRLALNFALKTGATSETVVITDAPPLMQTEEASIGQVIPTEVIEETPLNGRNWVYIAQLTAGVDPPEGTRGAGKGDFNANGQRAEQNNYILDGVDNNTNVVDFLNGASYVVRPPPDALAEFKIQTSDYSAEFGHSAGAVVNASLKSGSNAVHGNLWEYVRNNDFDAKDWEAPSVPAYHENQFGATLGFPILKNRLFFFGDTEANRIAFSETDSLTVPTAQMRNGDFSQLLNATFAGGTPIHLTDPGSTNPMGTKCGAAVSQPNVMCPADISPVSQSLLKLYPAPAPSLSIGAFLNNYLATRPAIDNTFQFDLRADWNVSDKDQAFARFSLLNEPGNRAAPLGSILDGGNFLSFGDDGKIVNRGDNFALSETHIFTTTLANEFRFGYNWGHFAYVQDNANNTGLNGSLGLGGVPGGALNGGLPTVNIGGISGFGSPEYYAANEYQNVFQILDNVSKSASNHTLKAGVSFQRIRFATAEPPISRGEYDYFSGSASCNDYSTTFTGYGVSDYLADWQGCAEISNLAGTDDVHWAQSAYAQDDWKATSKLTLNLGLRYEYAQPYQERYGHQAEWHPTGPLVAGNTPSVYLIPKKSENVSLGTSGILSMDQITLQYSDNPALIAAGKLDFAPRVGFAYRVNGQATVRGGFGVFYGGLESTGYNPNLGENFPFVFQSAYYPNPTQSGCTSSSTSHACLTDGISLGSGFTNAISQGLVNAVVTPSLRGSDPNPKIPYSEDYSLAVEVGITKDTVATLSYVGSSNRHLSVLTNPNAPLALLTNGANQSVEQPLSDFGGAVFSSYAGESSYNALQAKLERRLSAGLSYLASYTYSHALDDAPTPLGANGDNGYPNTNIQPIRGQYSNSPFDTRQRFTVNGNYALPFGRGQRFIKSAGWTDYLVGGWSSSLSFAAQTGNPFSVTPNFSSTSSFVEATGLSTVYAIRVGDPFKGGGTPPSSNPGITCPTSVRNKNHWYNPCAFGNPLFGTNIPAGQSISGAAALAYMGGRRNDVYGPGYERVNMSLFKNFPIEKASLQFRADMFNLLNTPSYANPNNNSSGGGLQSGDNDISSNGGQITQPRMFQAFTPDARFFQLSLKLSY